MFDFKLKKVKLYFCILTASYFAIFACPFISLAQDSDSQPSLDLHPPIDTSPANNSVPVNAKQPINSDFYQHIQGLPNLRSPGPSRADTGAQDDSNQVILEKHQPGIAGPSRAVGEYNVQGIDISRPKLKSLISVNDYLNPFTLDANASTTISLNTALLTGLENNLDLAISRTNTKQYQNAYYSALGKFLPDPILGFRQFNPKGNVGLPFNLASLSASPTISSLGVASGKESTVHIDHPFVLMNAGGEFYAYRGGSVLFGALQARNNYRASAQQEHATLSDTLMTITRNYYNLVLGEALLRIRIDAVRTSEEQLRRNQDRFHSGLATNLDVLQSKTQLSRDRQALVDQQTNRRSSAITLADSLNLTFAQDLMPVDLELQKMRLIDPRLDITKLLRIAIDNRPELKQYEELRLAAKRAIVVAAAGLQPTVALSGYAYGIGPPNNLQSLGVFAINVNWHLRGMGIVDSMNTNQARWQARQAMLQAQKELQTVCNQVRNSYISSLDKERNLEESTNEVKSSLEELRLAELRKASGLGINLDIITAQRDYTQARVSQAQALIDFNIAQAQLVHDLGMISTEALTSGKLLGESR